MLETISRVFIAILMLAALSGIALSMAALFLPQLMPSEVLATGHMQAMEGFSLAGPRPAESASPDDSPYPVDITLRTPPLTDSDILLLGISASGKELGIVDCLEGFDAQEDYLGSEEVTCIAYLPYDYEPGATYSIVAVLSRGGKEYSAGPATVTVDWHAYESQFVNFSWVMGLSVLLIYLLILLPVSIFVVGTAMKTSHRTIAPEEYAWKTMLSPLSFGKTFLQKFHALLISPYFWALEAAGIVIILLYMAMAAEMWKSYTAFIAFIFSGLMALVIPLLWCAGWWYADYREREPLRVIVTFFLWGGLAALMAIGLNTVADVGLAALGLGFLGTFLVAPVVEELYKGSGLTLLSEHHEFDSVEDGIVFGFTIGMGFSFIENWIYFIGNPMGSDVPGWLALFIMRSVFFSANHGFYTAITGGVIGYFIERKLKAPGLALLAGFPVAAAFHAMHNSGEMLATLLGAGGTLVYCCLLIPLFDYGGFIILMLFFIRSVMRQKAA
ncbi:PrsW family intramembrane metalloprotease [Candidatus Micrarchaeota archaeon]|nr:PrsW family intramembrane metalloprotease [Candidatus Micrarchaeota archaeon]